MGVVVVGIDGSDQSEGVLRYALAEARARGASLRVVHAWEIPGIAYADVPKPTEQIEREFESTARGVLDHFVEALRQEAEGVEVAAELRRDPPAKALVDASADAELLVVGSRGHGRLVGFFVGSVGRDVERGATCRIAIVPR